MKTLVIYTSQTGFTKRYADWNSEELNADIYDLKDVKKKTNDFFETYEAHFDCARNDYSVTHDQKRENDWKVPFNRIIWIYAIYIYELCISNVLQ